MAMQTSQVEKLKQITNVVAALLLSHAQDKHDITNKPIG
jgi:nitrate reductase NapAB chaperone NapD